MGKTSKANRQRNRQTSGIAIGVGKPQEGPHGGASSSSVSSVPSAKSEVLGDSSATSRSSNPASHKGEQAIDSEEKRVPVITRKMNELKIDLKPKNTAAERNYRWRTWWRSSRPYRARRWLWDCILAVRRMPWDGQRIVDTIISLGLLLASVYAVCVAIDFALGQMKGVSAQDIDANCSVVYVTVPGPIITVSLIGASPSNPARATYFYSVVNGTTGWLDSITPPSRFSTLVTRTPEITPIVTSIVATESPRPSPISPSSGIMPSIPGLIESTSALLNGSNSLSSPSLPSNISDISSGIGPINQPQRPWPSPFSSLAVPIPSQIQATTIPTQIPSAPLPANPAPLFPLSSVLQTSSPSGALTTSQTQSPIPGTALYSPSMMSQTSAAIVIITVTSIISGSTQFTITTLSPTTDIISPPSMPTSTPLTPLATSISIVISEDPPGNTVSGLLTIVTRFSPSINPASTMSLLTTFPGPVPVVTTSDGVTTPSNMIATTSYTSPTESLSGITTITISSLVISVSSVVSGSVPSMSTRISNATVTQSALPPGPSTSSSLSSSTVSLSVRPPTTTSNLSNMRTTTAILAPTSTLPMSSLSNLGPGSSGRFTVSLPNPPTTPSISTVPRPFTTITTVVTRTTAGLTTTVISTVTTFLQTVQLSSDFSSLASASAISSSPSTASSMSNPLSTSWFLSLSTASASTSPVSIESSLLFTPTNVVPEISTSSVPALSMSSTGVNSSRIAPSSSLTSSLAMMRSSSAPRSSGIPPTQSGTVSFLASILSASSATSASSVASVTFPSISSLLFTSNSSIASSSSSLPITSPSIFPSTTPLLRMNSTSTSLSSSSFSLFLSTPVRSSSSTSSLTSPGSSSRIAASSLSSVLPSPDLTGTSRSSSITSSMTISSVVRVSLASTSVSPVPSSISGFMTIQTETTAVGSSVTIPLSESPPTSSSPGQGFNSTPPVFVHALTTKVISFGDTAISFIFPSPDITTTVSYWTGEYPTVTGPLPTDLQAFTMTTRTERQTPLSALPSFEVLSSRRPRIQTVVTTLYDEDDETTSTVVNRRDQPFAKAVRRQVPTPQATPGALPSPDSCGESGNFTLGFDDTVVGDDNDNILLVANGMKNPYHHLFYANGFTYVPDKWEPYPAVSQPNVAMFLPLTGRLLPSTPFSGTLLPGELGAGPRASVNAYWFNAYSGYFGCALSGITPCTLRISGYRYDATLKGEVVVAEQNVTIPACWGYIHCQLTQVFFNEQFTALSGIQFNAFTYNLNIPQVHMMDNLQLEWYNNTCSAGILRIGNQ